MSGTAAARGASLRRAAFHEASHASLVLYFGGLAQPRIFRDCHGCWHGTCVILAAPGRPIPPHLAKVGMPRRTPKHWSRYVGFAGAIGAALSEPSPDDAEIFNALTTSPTDFMSRTDLDMVGDVSPRVYESALLKTIDMVRCVWPHIEAEALWLIECAKDKRDAGAVAEDLRKSREQRVRLKARAGRPRTE